MTDKEKDYNVADIMELIKISNTRNFGCTDSRINQPIR